MEEDLSTIKENKRKNSLLFLLFSLIMGAIAGGAIWTFLTVMNLGIDFIWVDLKSKWDGPWFHLAMCLTGALLIGLLQRKYGDYPESLETVMEGVKRTGTARYDNIHILATAAILPLLFGGSIGPEAGLTGAIAGICAWIGDKFKHLHSEMKNLGEIGAAASLSMIFNAPLFGIMNEFEERSDRGGTLDLPKRAKTLVYLTCVCGGFAMFMALGHFFGGGMGFGKVGAFEGGKVEYLLLIPLALIGAVCGIFFSACNKICSILARPFAERKILRALIGGVVLAVMGMILPLTMFAGEVQMEEVIEQWQTMTVAVLLLTGIGKLFLTNFCIHMGWRGGTIFPIIFSGVSIGFGLATLLPVNPAFAVTVVTAALVGFIMKKPLAVSLLLLLCFPVSSVFVICIAATIGSALPEPEFLKIKEKSV